MDSGPQAKTNNKTERNAKYITKNNNNNQHTCKIFFIIKGDGVEGGWW